MGSIIIRDRSGASYLPKQKEFTYEDVLQIRIAESPSIIPLETVTDSHVNHLTIGTEWPAGKGSADIVLIGSDAVLTVVETKLRRNPGARREVVGQILEYAAYLSEWTVYEIGKQAEVFFESSACPAKYAGKTFDAILEDFLRDAGGDDDVHAFKGRIEQNLREGRIRLVVAVDRVGEQAQRIVTFVNSHSSSELYLLQVTAFEDNEGRDIFVPTLFGFSRKVSSPSDLEPWDWDRYERELGTDFARRGKALIGRLLIAAKKWSPNVEFHSDYIDLVLLDDVWFFGVQYRKRTGLISTFGWIAIRYRTSLAASQLIRGSVIYSFQATSKSSQTIS